MSGILAIIPARSGSKRLRNKNRRIFCGKPLVHWTILQAERIKEIDRIVFTTDYGCHDSAGWGFQIRPDDSNGYGEWTENGKKRSMEHRMRPKHLRGDDVPMAHVICDVLAQERKLPDLCVLLQPTSPTRTDETVRACIEGAAYWGHDFTIDKNGAPNGACYVFPPNRLPPLPRVEGLVAACTMRGMSGIETDDIDIDELSDFEAAEKVMRERMK